MIVDLVRALRDAGLRPSPVDVADALWLARHLDALGAPDEGETGGPESPAGPPPPLPAAEPPKEEGRRESTPGAGAAELHPSASDGGHAPAGLVGTTFLTPAAPALPDALAIARALRPLKRKVPSRRERAIDEEATVHRVAEGGPVQPVLRPVRERWLEAALVVEGCESTALWRSTVMEFRRILERSGAFRDVRLWILRHEPDRGVVVAPDGAPDQARDPRALLNPSGRRLILVASDFTSDLWFSEEVAQALVDWSAASPTALLSLLPERLFPQTAIGRTGRVQAPGPGSPTARLCQTRLAGAGRRRGPVRLALPVAALEPRALAPWASMVANASPDVPAVFLAGTAGAVARRGVVEADPGPAEPDARGAVERFRATASPLAVELASYLAAAPLTLRIMRLVQSAMLPRSSHVHLTEVFLSGLLRRVTDAPEQDNVLYDFVGDARDRLLGDLRVSDALQVLEGISEFISTEMNAPNRFLSVLRGLEAEGDIPFDEADRPFAMVAARVLRRLGGRYARLAAALDAFDAPARGAITGPQRRLLREGADDYAILVSEDSDGVWDVSWWYLLITSWLTDADRGRIPPAHIHTMSMHRAPRNLRLLLPRLVPVGGRRLYLYLVGRVGNRNRDHVSSNRSDKGLAEIVNVVVDARRFAEIVILVHARPLPSFEPSSLIALPNETFGARCTLLGIVGGPEELLPSALNVLSRARVPITVSDLARHITAVLEPARMVVQQGDTAITFPVTKANTFLLAVKAATGAERRIGIFDTSDVLIAAERVVAGAAVLRLPPGSYTARGSKWREWTSKVLVTVPSFESIAVLEPPHGSLRYSDTLIWALGQAELEAIRLRHDFQSTEHLLLGLIGAEDGDALLILRDLGVDLGKVRPLIEQHVRRGKAAIDHTALPVPYTSRARMVMEFARAESFERRDAYVGTEHFLCGLLREEKGLAAEVLMMLGVTLDDVLAVAARIEASP